ncbi:hypothetical protein ALI22I_40090 [Saccharothrix sp. ALI-22-I]|nr:hypothetical protein ALI22I_40090 [Saccharothrix sp. ALI-22-I]
MDSFARWRKSGRSGGSNQCVECAAVADDRAIRDSKAPHNGAVVVSAAAFAGLIAAVKAGRYDL